MCSVSVSMAKPALEIKVLPILPELVEQVNSRFQNTECFKRQLIKQNMIHPTNDTIKSIKPFRN